VDLSDRRVLVTGAEGFIGRALCARLRESGIPYTGAVRALDDRTREHAPLIALGDFAAAEWGAALSGVDSIVHLAGRSHVQTAADPHDPTPYIVANVHVTRRLCDAASRAEVRRIVLVSSVKVYGEDTAPGRPFRAADPASPRDAYAHSKAEAENVLWEMCRRHGIEGVVLRLPLTYGPGVKGNFLALLEAIAAERHLPLAGITNRRSFLNVANAASAIEAALDRPALAGATLPVADAESLSTSELAGRLARALGVTAHLFHVPAPVMRAAAALTGKRAGVARLLGSLEVDARRFCELASWSPPHTVDEGLAATAAWWKLRHVL
jgi:nucleoside-diphosphate-sugar epimerase